MVPTHRLLSLLILVAPLSVLPLMIEDAWIALLGAWIVVMVIVAFEAARLTSTRASLVLDVPRQVGVGSTVRARVRVQSSGRTSLWARLRLVVVEPLICDQMLEVRLAPGLREIEMPIQADRRGTGAVHEAWLELRAPFGLLRKIVSSKEGARSVAVVPDAERIDRATVSAIGAEPMLAGLKRERATGEGGEFESLHQYSAGMDLDAVDWKASARHLQLRVRRFHVERRQRLVLCLDVGRTMRDPIDGLERLDHAVHTALILAKASLRAGDLVGMHAYADRPSGWVPPRGGASQYSRIRHACAALHAEPEETNHVLGLHDLLSRIPRRSLIVVFTEFDDATTAELMLEVLAQLVSRHVILFVALDDPTLFAERQRSPEHMEHLARALVASHLFERREAVLSRLRRMGVHVVHSAPNEVAARVISRYVDIKQRGLIG